MFHTTLELRFTLNYTYVYIFCLKEEYISTSQCCLRSKFLKSSKSKPNKNLPYIMQRRKKKKKPRVRQFVCSNIRTMWQI